LALFATQAHAENSKCYALAFSSGDQSSAYTAGVLQGMLQSLSKDETAYSAVSGVSGGGVNAAILGSYASGQELDAANRMVQFWQNTTKQRLYKDWLGGWIQGLTVEPGLFNNKELEPFLQTELADIGTMQRFTDVGITNVLSGAFQDNTQSLDTNLVDVMAASFAYAGFFPPAESMDGTWFDGSVIWDLDIFSAVNRCMETHEQKDVVVDVLLTSEKTLRVVDASKYNSI
jgi:predicted acylesterase/phospholipase RssA